MTAPIEDWSRKEKLLNWAGCYEYGINANHLHQPRSIEEVQELVRRVDKIKAVGTRHCFNGIADSKHNMLCTVNLNQIYHLDKHAHTVTIGPGIHYGALATYLHENGFALENMASLPHISVGGSIATATHGSGSTLRCLSTAVEAIEFVKPNGELMRLKKGHEDFNGAVVSIGGLGIVTKYTLSIQPSFQMKQIVYLNLPMSVLKNHFEEIMSSGYSVSLYTRFQDQNIYQVRIKSLADPNHSNHKEFDFERFGAKKIVDRDVRSIIELPADFSTVQRGIPGPWHERLPHIRIDSIPGATGAEVHSEYFFPIERAYEAIMAVESFRERIDPLVYTTEIRTIEADEFWLSPCYKQRSVAIHFTWKQDVKNVMQLLSVMEEKLKPLKARPHWGKLFTFTHEYLESVYEKLPRFRQLLIKYDPHGKFRNEFLDKYIFGKKEERAKI